MTNNVSFEKSTKSVDKKSNQIEIKNKTEISFPIKDNKLEENKVDLKNKFEDKTDNVKDINSSIVNPNSFDFEIELDKDEIQKKHQQNIIDKMNSMSKEYIDSSTSMNNSRISKVGEQLLNSKKTLKELSEDEITQFKNILDKYKNDEIVNSEDLQALKNITSKVDSKNHHKSTFNSLLDTSEKVIGGENVFNEKYTKATKKVDRSITNLNNEIENLPPNKRNGFTRALGVLMRKYQIALDSGNEVQVAMYAALLDKIINAIKEGKSGEDIDNIIANYDKLVRSLSSKNLTDEQKIELIKDYVGDKVFAFLKDASDDKLNEKNNTPQYSNRFFVSQVIKDLGVNLDTNDNINFHEPLLTDLERQDLRKTTFSQIKDVLDKVPNFKKALESFEISNRELIDIQKKLGEVIINSKILNNKSNQAQEENIRERINDLIKNAESLEDNLNLDIEIGEVTINSLLEKFREIIIKLDLDIRNNLLHHLESILISQKNTLYIEDMKIRRERFEKIREEIKKLFQGLA